MGKDKIQNNNILNNINFQKEVLENRDPVIVEFGAEWCGSSHIISPIINGLLSEFKKKMKLYKVDIDNNKDLSEKYSIQVIPTLLFFKNGQVVDHITGAFPKKVLAEKINKLLKE